jgi:hypothetical protein
MEKPLWIAFYCIADHRTTRLDARAVSASQSERVFEACLPAAKTTGGQDREHDDTVLGSVKSEGTEASNEMLHRME